MTAKVLSETWLDEDGRPTALEAPLVGGDQPIGLDPYLGANYAIQPLEVLKGSPPQQLTLFSENTTARFPMKVGATYLLFVYEATDTDPPYLHLDSCGNSGLLDNRTPILADVRRLALGGSPLVP